MNEGYTLVLSPWDQMDTIGSQLRRSYDIVDTISISRSQSCQDLYGILIRWIPHESILPQVIDIPSSLLDIGAGRMPTDDDIVKTCRVGSGQGDIIYWQSELDTVETGSSKGRWPPNIICVHDDHCDDTCVPSCPLFNLQEHHLSPDRYVKKVSELDEALSYLENVIPSLCVRMDNLIS